MGTVLQAGALLLVGLVVVQACFYLVQSFGQLRERRRQYDLDRRLLLGRIDTARLRHVHKKDSIDSWDGYRKFVVDRVGAESDRTSSVYLSAHDRRRLPVFFPGQHLTFRFKLPADGREVHRCYTISDHPNASRYRISVKHLDSPAGSGYEPGVASTYLHELLAQGDIVDVKAPKGDFFLDLTTSHPIVCIAGGIGVTPFISMLRALQVQRSVRETWLFFGVRNEDQYPFSEFLESYARDNPNFHLHLVFSQRMPESKSDDAKYHEGHCNPDLIKSQLPSNNFEFFVCGPPPMMHSVVSGLHQWGVPKKMVRFEAFGAAGVLELNGNIMDSEHAKTEDDEPVVYIVTYLRSGKTVPWTPGSGTLLDLGVAKGVSMESGCCTGECLSCEVAVVSGYVDYLRQPSEKPREGSCLPCICVPKTHLKLDA